MFTLAAQDNAKVGTEGAANKIEYIVLSADLSDRKYELTEAIAPIRVKASLEDAAIPTLVTFLEMYPEKRIRHSDSFVKMGWKHIRGLLKRFQRLSK